MKKLLAFIVAVALLCGLTSCFGISDGGSGSSSSGNSKYEIVGELDMSVDHNSYFGYSVEIKGKLKNITKREFSYVSVTFAVYDAEGNQLGTALDNMNYLQPGAIWSFKAVMLDNPDVQPRSCKLVNVEMW